MTNNNICSMTYSSSSCTCLADVNCALCVFQDGGTRCIQKIGYSEDTCTEIITERPVTCDPTVIVMIVFLSMMVSFLFVYVVIRRKYRKKCREYEDSEITISKRNFANTLKSTDPRLTEDIQHLREFIDVEKTNVTILLHESSTHTETRTRTVTDSNGNSRTETYTVTVADRVERTDITDLYSKIPLPMDEEPLLAFFNDKESKMKTLWIYQEPQTDIYTDACEYIKAQLTLHITRSNSHHVYIATNSRMELKNFNFFAFMNRHWLFRVWLFLSCTWILYYPFRSIFAPSKTYIAHLHYPPTSNSATLQQRWYSLNPQWHSTIKLTEASTSNGTNLIVVNATAPSAPVPSILYSSLSRNSSSNIPSGYDDSSMLPPDYDDAVKLSR